MSPGNVSKESSSEVRRPSGQSSRETLNDTIAGVRKFHKAIEQKYKLPTYAHYGAQGERNRLNEKGGILGTGMLADDDRYAWGEVAWEGVGIAGLDPYTIKVNGDDANGSLTLNSGQTLRIAPPDCPGDGTVPVYSGEAPAKAGIDKGVVMSFAHGQGKPGPCNAHFGYDHQESYGDTPQRSLFATMYAIVKIAQQAQWHKQ